MACIICGKEAEEHTAEQDLACKSAYYLKLRSSPNFMKDNIGRPRKQ